MTGAPNATANEIRKEQQRLRYLRTLVDLTTQIIMQGGLERADAERLVEATRQQVLRLFPGQDQTYDLIYRPRFERLVREFAKSGGRLLPFRPSRGPHPGD